MQSGNAKILGYILIATAFIFSTTNGYLIATGEADLFTYLQLITNILLGMVGYYHIKIWRNMERLQSLNHRRP